MDGLLIIAIIVAILISFALLVWLIDRGFSAPRYRGPVTGHFNGNKFQNTEPPNEAASSTSCAGNSTENKDTGIRGPILNQGQRHHDASTVQSYA